MMTSVSQGALHLRRFGRELVSKPAISSTKRSGRDTVERLPIVLGEVARLSPFFPADVDTTWHRTTQPRLKVVKTTGKALLAKRARGSVGILAGFKCEYLSGM